LVFFAAFMWSSTVVSAAESRRWRIMPVGDSITEGGKSFSTYRIPLFEKLTEAGYAITYVGSRKRDSKLGILWHQGSGGKNAEYLAATVPAAFKKHPADVVLLHAGHNHFAHEKPIPNILAATRKIIEGIRAENSTVIVLLAQVIPSGKLPKYGYIPELNRELKRLASALHTDTKPVIIVDQASGFDWRTDTIADKVHPNAQGAEKMAERWCEALKKVLSK
jgi:lysophospholipase L1-like esterase